jgi:hypothetical protein
LLEGYSEATEQVDGTSELLRVHFCCIENGSQAEYGSIACQSGTLDSLVGEVMVLLD